MLLVDATVLVLITKRGTGLVGRDPSLKVFREGIGLVRVWRRLVFAVVMVVL